MNYIWITIFARHVDDWGCVGNIMLDQSIEVGDSLQRMGMMFAYERWTGETLVLRLTQKPNVSKELKDGFVLAFLYPPRRHLNEKSWEGQAGSLSRDNALSMIVGSRAFASAIFPMLVKRLGFFWNVVDLEGVRKSVPIPDLMGPVTLGAITRSSGWWWLFALVGPITDLFLLLQVIFRVLYSRINPRHTSDELNTQVILEQASRTYGTPFSWLANKIYFRWGPVWALRSYFRPRSKMKPPPIHLLYEDLFQDKWKNKETIEHAIKRGMKF